MRHFIDIASRDDARSRKRFWFAFWVGIFVRAVALARLWHVGYTSDARDYTTMAVQLVHGQHFVPYWPSGLPLFLSIFVALGGGNGVLRLAMLLFWLLAVWGLYRLTRATGTFPVAWIILLVFGLAPGSVQLSLEPLTQLPVAALLLVALSATLRCCEGAGMGEYLLLGAMLGGMTLVRPSAIPLFMLAGFPLLLAPGSPAKRSGRVAATILLGLAIIGGWLVRSHEISGAWVMNTSNAENFWDGNNPWTPMYRTWYFGSHAKLGSPEINRFPAYKQVLEQTTQLPALEQQARFSALAKQYLLAHPGVFALRTFNRIRCFWGFDTFTSETLRHARPRWFWPTLGMEFLCYMLLMAPAWFWIAAAGRPFWRDRRVWALVGAVVVYAAPYWMSMSHPTYHYPVLVPVFVLGAMAWLGSRDRKDVPSYTRGWIAVAVLVAIQVEWVVRMAAANLR